jgi:hypothetical protein
MTEEVALQIKELILHVQDTLYVIGADNHRHQARKPSL